MGTVKAVNRDHRITVRFTESEWEQIRADMNGNDYLSQAKYVREVLLRRKGPVRTVKITDRAIRDQINEISKKISRIGSNYNQVVKKYNTSCTAKKKNGDPVINSKATIFYIEKLISLTGELRNAQSSLIEQVSRLQLDDES